jgi:hypothetical protein
VGATVRAMNMVQHEAGITMDVEEVVHGHLHTEGGTMADIVIEVRAQDGVQTRTNCRFHTVIRAMCRMFK